MYILPHKIKFDKKKEAEGSGDVPPKKEPETPPKKEEPAPKPGEPINIMQTSEKIVYEKPDLAPVLSEMSKLAEKVDKLIPKIEEPIKPTTDDKKEKDVVELLGELL